MQETVHHHSDHVQAADGPQAIIHRWTQAGGRELMTHVHLPGDGRAGAVVVIAEGLGRDQVVGLQPTRVLADRLARSGAVAVRFSWSGTADSSEPDGDQPCTRRWVDDLDAVATLARSVVPGVPLAVVALRAASAVVTEHARLGTVRPDQIVLWEPVGSGKSWLRAQSTLHKVSAEFRARTSFPALPEGSVETPGWLVSKQDAAALRALLVSVPDGVALDVVKRPHLLVDKALAPVLAGARSVVELHGQPEMFDAPTLLAKVDVPTVEAIVGLVDRSEPATVTAPAPRREAVVARAASAGAPVDVVEEILEVDGMHAVLTRAIGEPRHGLVTVPGSAEPMDGPTGLWTRLARRAAARGVTTLRLDRTGVGESAELDRTEPLWPYRRSSVDDLAAAVDVVRGRAHCDPVMVGMCSGAWIATQVALERPVPAVIAVNQIAWDLDALPEGNPVPAVIDIVDSPGVFPSPDDAAGALPTVPASVRLRQAVKGSVPAPAWSWLARRGKVQMALPLYDRLTRTGTALHQILSDGDLAYVDGQQMRYVQRRLSLAGRQATITRRPELDHALLSYAARERAINDILSLINRMPVSPHRG